MSKAGCPKYALPGKSRCAQHEAEHEAWRKQQGFTGRRGSTRSWRMLRARVIRAAGRRCQVCGAAGQLEVHHVDGDANNDSFDNLRAMCPECHKKAQEKLRRNRPKTPPPA